MITTVHIIRRDTYIVVDGFPRELLALGAGEDPGFIPGIVGGERALEVSGFVVSSGVLWKYGYPDPRPLSPAARCLLDSMFWCSRGGWLVDRLVGRQP